MAKSCGLGLYWSSDPGIKNQEWWKNIKGNIKSIAMKATEAERELLSLCIRMQNQLDHLSSEVSQLRAEVRRDVNELTKPRLVGLVEACEILSISRRTMMTRLAGGQYPFAKKHNGEWKFPLYELQRIINLYN